MLSLLEREYYGTLLTLTLIGGLRRSEVLGLRWCDVDLETGWLFIRQGLKEVNGRLCPGPVKTKAGERNVKLPQAVVDMLRAHQVRQRDRRQAAGQRWVGAGEAGDLVFTTRKGKPFMPRSIYRRFRQLLERNGLPPMSLHGLRRTASSVVSSQTDILTAARMLGHAHAQVTARHYARAGEDAAERAAEALERELLEADNPVQLARNLPKIPRVRGRSCQTGGQAPPSR